jgi:predicted AlkP superfamily pyrophosphatase or phosphodiesterase
MSFLYQSRNCLLGLFWMLVLVPAGVASAANSAPALVLQITVDQLRADLLTRNHEHFGEGGFRYLGERGVVYRDAHHAHANTETIVGHTTLATGAQPAVHGMVGNLWRDREARRTVYNVEDSRYRLLTEGADVDQDAEIDPTQRAARSEGRSPSAILTTTFSDELVAATNGAAKVIGVSVKDRGAISMAGHAGTAYWFSKASGQFVTSSYYLDRYPGWVIAHNAGEPASAYAGQRWSLLQAPETYRFIDSDDRPWETAVGAFGRVFPHEYGDGSSPYFTTWLTLSPAGDRLVLDFALAAIEGEGLGRDEVTDYLSVSFSATDYVGHVFGPSSLEAEDNLRHLDRTIADLLANVDRLVGLDRTLIILSADHGGPDAPGYLQSHGIPAGYVDPESWNGAAALERVKRRFSIEDNLIESYSHPYLYLSDAVVSNPAVDRAAIEAALVDELQALDDVALAVASESLRTGKHPDTPLHRAVLNNFHPKRSGDIFLVFEPNRFINDFDGLTVASTHGSPWAYDTHVPVIFAGHGLVPAKVDRRVETVSVAPTLSAYLGIREPSGAAGPVLVEVTRGR